MNLAMAVMAKAPIPGRSKTRLMPALSASQAAALSAAFLRDVTENILAAARLAPMAGYVAYAPPGTQDLFAGHLAVGTRLVLADGAIAPPPGVTGFGLCLLHAMGALLAVGHPAVCLLNSDSPNLPTAYLARAARLLARPGERAVLGPAEDGGYYLLGMKTAHAHLFTDIAWSTEHAAAQTIARAREVGLEMELLPCWYDVDDAASLQRLLAQFASPAGPGPGPTPYAAPATRDCLAQFGLTVDAL